MTQAERYYRMYERMCTLIANHGTIGMGIDYSTALRRCYFWKLSSRGYNETGLRVDTCEWIDKRESERLHRITRTELPEQDFHRYCEKVRFEKGW